MARSKSTATAANAQPEPITLVGRLCADPALRETKSGKAVTTIRVAVNPPEGEATFHSVVVWHKTAKAVCQFKRKGHHLEIVGLPPQERTYQDRDGNDRQVSEIIALRVEFLTRGQFVAKTQPERELAA
jgi:single-strand DNA-binding protein